MKAPFHVLVLIAAGSALVASACGNSDSGANAAGLSVVATTTQIADMARAIAGDQVEVISLLPANADPHDFEPTPQDLAKVDDADLVLEHGFGLDAWAKNLVDASGTDATVVVVTTGIVPFEDEALQQGEHAHDTHDPHVWFDVINAKAMAAGIRDALIAADPAGRAGYTERAASYLADLDTLDTWIREQVATIPADQRKLVTNHDAFGYYVRAYGFEYVGSIIPSMDTQAQPSAQETADLIDAIRAEDVKAIFTEQSLNPELARQIADEAGVAIVDDLYGDSLGPHGSGAETYIGMMRTNTTNIVEALR